MAKLTPDEMLEVARSVVTKENVEDLMRGALADALSEEPTPQARLFVREIILPKDTTKVEDTRFKRVVFCTFEQFGQVEQYKKTIVDLTARVKELEQELKELLGQ